MTALLVILPVLLVIVGGSPKTSSFPPTWYSSLSASSQAISAMRHNAFDAARCAFAD